MERLRESELRAVTAIVHDSYACLDLDGFPDRVLGAVRRLIPADHVSYNEIDPRTYGTRTVVRPAGADRFPGDAAAFARHLPEHPFVAHLARLAGGRAHTISDFLSRARFHRLGIYDAYYRRLGVEHQMVISLAPSSPVAVGLALSRHAPDFSARERALLDLLGPHLRQAHGNAVAVTRLRRRLAAAEAALGAGDQAVVWLSARGAIRAAGARAHRWLAEYFGRPRGGAAGLPEEVRRWIRGQAASAAALEAPRRPLVRARAGRRLEVRLVGHGGEALLLLRERATGVDPETLLALGLSRREAQVLAGVATGQRNDEVAAALGSRPRTVAKHLERIYAKLGVGTRTAAAARVLALAADDEADVAARA